MGKIHLLTQAPSCRKQVIGIVWHSCMILPGIRGSTVDIMANSLIECHSYL